MEAESVILEAYQGEESEVYVELSGEGKPINEIGAKAFLSCKSVERLILSDNILKIGDWAFAHMQKLKVLILPQNELILGKKVFLDCEELMQIQIRNDESGNPGTAYFMASAIRILKNEALCKPEKAGSKTGHKEWMKEYDRALCHFLEERDEEGFEPVFIGWFHVEDTDEQLPRYLTRRRREKTELVFQRLLYPMYLDETSRNVLYEYLRDHMPEGRKEKEHTMPFSMLCDPQLKYGKEIRYIKLLDEAKALRAAAIPPLLLQKDGSAEVTAFLLQKQQTLQKEKDFFSELTEL